MGLEGTAFSGDVNNHNADSGTGIRPQAESVSLTLCTEQQQIIDDILSAVGSGNIDVALSSRASESTLSAIKLKTDNLDSLLSTRSSESTLSSLNAKIPALGQQSSGSSMSVVLAAGFTSPISAIALPLPAGAATEATLLSLGGKDFATQTTLALILADTAVIKGKDFATQTTLSEIKSQTDKLNFSASRLFVDGSGVTQPISAISLPLPSGASTESTLSTFSAKFGSIGQQLPSNSSSVVTAAGFTVPVSAVTLPLPTGAATETTLALLNGKDFATQSTLALVKAKTDNVDVALSTRATETTLSTLVGKDFATQTTLALVKADLDSVIAVEGAPAPPSGINIGGCDDDGNLACISVAKVVGYNHAHVVTLDQIAYDTMEDRVFCAIAEVNVSTTVETNFMLLRNPAASGKNMLLRRAIFDCATKGGQGMFRYYASPTGITAGTTIVPKNRKLGSAVVSSMTASYSPTATKNIYCGETSVGANANSVVNEIHGDIILIPGQDLLITAQVDANNRVMVANIIWMEALV